MFQVSFLSNTINFGLEKYGGDKEDYFNNNIEVSQEQQELHSYPTLYDMVPEGKIPFKGYVRTEQNWSTIDWDSEYAYAELMIKDPQLGVNNYSIPRIGHFEATESFESYAVNEQPNDEWNFDGDGVRVIETFENHYKVLNCTTSESWQNVTYDPVGVLNSLGMIEFSFYLPSGNASLTVNLLADNSSNYMPLRFGNDTGIYYTDYDENTIGNTSYVATGKNFSLDEWVHIRLECWILGDNTGMDGPAPWGTYNAVVHRNGELVGTMGRKLGTPFTHIGGMNFTTDSYGTFYLDALDVSSNDTSYFDYRSSYLCLQYNKTLPQGQYSCRYNVTDGYNFTTDWVPFSVYAGYMTENYPTSSPSLASAFYEGWEVDFEGYIRDDMNFGGTMDDRSKLQVKDENGVVTEHLVDSGVYAGRYSFTNREGQDVSSDFDQQPPIVNPNENGTQLVINSYKGHKAVLKGIGMLNLDQSFDTVTEGGIEFFASISDVSKSTFVVAITSTGFNAGYLFGRLNGQWVFIDGIEDLSGNTQVLEPFPIQNNTWFFVRMEFDNSSIHITINDYSISFDAPSSLSLSRAIVSIQSDGAGDEFTGYVDSFSRSWDTEWGLSSYCKFNKTLTFASAGDYTYRFASTMDSGLHSTYWNQFFVQPIEPNVRIISESDIKISRFDFLDSTLTYSTLENFTFETEGNTELFDEYFSGGNYFDIQSGSESLIENMTEISNQTWISQNGTHSYFMSENDTRFGDSSFAWLNQRIDFYLGQINASFDNRNWLLFQGVNVSSEGDSIFKYGKFQFWLKANKTFDCYDPPDCDLNYWDEWNDVYFNVYIVNTFNETNVTWNSWHSSDNYIQDLGSFVNLESDGIAQGNWSVWDYSIPAENLTENYLFEVWDDGWYAGAPNYPYDKASYFTDDAPDENTRPRIKYVFPKFGSIDDILLVQTNEDETFSVSRAISQSVNPFDRIRIRFKTNSRHQISCEAGETFSLIEEGNTNFEWQEATFVYPITTLIDEILISGNFDADTFLYIDYITIERPSGIPYSFHVSPKGVREVFLPPDFYKLDIFVNNLLKDSQEVNVYSSSTSDNQTLVFYIPIFKIEAEINIYNLRSDLLDFELFRVNLTRVYENETITEWTLVNRFFADEGSLVEIEIFDRFFQSLYNYSNYISTFIDIIIDVNSFKILNQMREATLFNLTRNELTFAEYILPGEIIEFQLRTNNYSIQYNQTELGIFINETIEIVVPSWYNISTAYQTTYFSAFTNEGLGLPPETIRLYIDNERKPWGQVELLGGSHTIEATDFFNQTVFLSTQDFEAVTEFNVLCNVWTLLVNNNFSVSMKIEIERGSFILEQIIPSQGGIEYRFLGGIEYTIRAYYMNGTLAETTTLLFDDTVELVTLGFYDIYAPIDPADIDFQGEFNDWLITLLMIVVAIVGMYFIFRQEQKRKKNKSGNNQKLNDLSPKSPYR
jgi:hypothetical protein